MIPGHQNITTYFPLLKGSVTQIFKEFFVFIYMIKNGLYSVENFMHIPGISEKKGENHPILLKLCCLLRSQN